MFIETLQKLQPSGACKLDYLKNGNVSNKTEIVVFFKLTRYVNSKIETGSTPNFWSIFKNDHCMLIQCLNEFGI